MSALTESLRIAYDASEEAANDLEEARLELTADRVRDARNIIWEVLQQVERAEV